jgi:L-cysteine desulfidase
MSVGIPGTGMTGLDVAAAIGDVGGDANGGLEVLRNIEENHVNLAKAMLENNRVVVKLKDVPDKFFIEVVCTNGEHYSGIIIKEGLTNNYGLGVGRTILKNIKNGLLSDDIQNYAMAITAGGADARMGGCMYPVMSCAGSGNQGLTAMLPVIAVAEKLKANNEILVRALAISLLTTIHIKSFIGRLSAICGCGTASSIGASSAITYLLGGELKNIEYTIKNLGIIASKGMEDTEKIILDIMLCK